MNKTLKNTIKVIAVASLFVGFGAYAADTIGDAAEAAEKSVLAVKSLLISIFFLIGIGLIGGGIYLQKKENDRPNEGHGKKGMVMIFCGAGLLCITSIAAMVAGTFDLDDGEATNAISAETGLDY